MIMILKKLAVMLDQSCVLRKNEIILDNYYFIKKWIKKVKERGRTSLSCFHSITKMKTPKEYYLRIFLLYMPWINKSKLKSEDQSFGERFRNVGNVITVT